MAAYLAQGDDWETAEPVGFYSQVCTPPERNYPQHNLEMLAVVGAARHFESVITGKKVHIWTDLTYVRTSACRNGYPSDAFSGRSCWPSSTSSINTFAGLHNQLADALSRLETTFQINTPTLPGSFDEEEPEYPAEPVGPVMNVTTRARSNPTSTRCSYSGLRCLSPSATSTCQAGRSPPAESGAPETVRTPPVTEQVWVDRVENPHAMAPPSPSSLMGSDDYLSNKLEALLNKQESAQGETDGSRRNPLNSELPLEPEISEF